jgi:hypothetical protein
VSNAVFFRTQDAYGHIKHTYECHRTLTKEHKFCQSLVANFRSLGSKSSKSIFPAYYTDDIFLFHVTSLEVGLIEKLHARCQYCGSTGWVELIVTNDSDTWRTNACNFSIRPTHMKHSHVAVRDTNKQTNKQTNKWNTKTSTISYPIIKTPWIFPNIFGIDVIYWRSNK